MSLCFSSAEGVLCLLSPAVLAHEAEGEFAAVGGGTESIEGPWGEVCMADNSTAW